MEVDRKVRIYLPRSHGLRRADFHHRTASCQSRLPFLDVYVTKAHAHFLFSRSSPQILTAGAKVRCTILLKGNIILASVTGPVTIQQMNSVLGTGVFNADGKHVHRHFSPLCLSVFSINRRYVEVSSTIPVVLSSCSNRLDLGFTEA